MILMHDIHKTWHTIITTMILAHIFNFKLYIIANLSEDFSPLEFFAKE